MLHMLRSMLGDKAFFSAITSYFTKNAYLSAVSRDLWKHLEQPARERGVLDGDSTIQSIMETWVNNSGSECDISVLKLLGFKTFPFFFKVSDSVSKKFGIEKSIGFGFVQILGIVTH